MTKIGITFGGYCPLHQGHLDLIMRSKKENDINFVVVCGYDGESRAEDFDLPLLKRYRIISNFLKDETTEVIYVNDTELGIDESYSDNNWKIWTKEIYLQIFSNKKYTDAVEVHGMPRFTWYVAELEYLDALHKNCNCPIKGSIQVIDCADRSENPVSGTLCRTDPLHYWNQITSPFRAYYSHNILIAGTASEGKTTLCQDLGRYFGLPYSYEKGRDICHLKTDPEFTVKDFIYNLYEQHKYNEELICSPQNPGVFVSDTDNMVTLMYAYAYAGRPGFSLAEEEYDLLKQIAFTYARTDKWNKIFLLAPKEKGIVDDGERYMDDSDYQIRNEYFEYLTSLYNEAGLKYEILTGNYYENFVAVKDYIQNLYK